MRAEGLNAASKGLRLKRILYVQYTNPAGYPPLEHGSRILAEQGWKVMFLGTGADGPADRFELPPHPNIEVRRLAFCPPGWRQKLHYLRFCFWTALTALRWKPDWIYVSDLMACPAGLFFTFWPGMRVAFHEHDSPIRDSASEPSLVTRMFLRARRKLGQRAAFHVLPNRRRLEQFRNDVASHQPGFCVWNCPERSEVAPPRPSESDPGLLRLFYHGSINPVRLPLTVLRAMAEFPDAIELQVAGYETVGHRGYVQELGQEAARLGIANQFHYLGTLARREELLEVCGTASVGLALMPMDSADLNEAAMTGASNKPFDYLSRGLALLVSDLPDWREMFVDAGYGLACNPADASSVSAALRWFLAHPIETRRMGEEGRQRIMRDWNYEAQFEPVTRLLNADCSQPLPEASLSPSPAKPASGRGCSSCIH